MDKDDTRLRRIRETTLAFVFYLGLLILVTWPLVIEFNTHAVGHPRLAVKTHLWQFWWTREAVLHSQWTLFWSPLLLAPNGVNVLNELGNILVPLISVPFQLVFGLVGGYNATILFLFASTGTATYALCRRYATSHAACLMGGAVYVFLPYAWMELYNGATEIAILLLIPLCILKLDSWLKEPTLSDGLVLGVLLFLSLMSSWYYGMFLVLCVGIGVAVKVFTQARDGMLTQTARKQLAIALLGTVFAATALALPFVVQIGGTQRVTSDWKWSAEDWDITAKANPDVIEVLGPWQHPTGESTIDFDIEETIPYSFAVFPGFLACIMGLAGLAAARKLPAYLWAIGVLFLVLFLGPWLKVFGITRALGFRLQLPAYTLATLSKSFAASILHSYRAIVLPALVLAVLAAVGMQHVLAKLNLRGWAKVALACFAAGIMAIEAHDAANLSRPMQTSAVDLSPILDTLRDAEGSGGVINAPLGVKTHVVGDYMLGQTVHHRPILSGRAADLSVVDLYSNIPDHLRHGLGVPGDMALAPAPEGLFRYLVVHWNGIRPEDDMRIRKMLMDHCILLAEDIERAITVYRIEDASGISGGSLLMNAL